jgi:hypothetical protein
MWAETEKNLPAFGTAVLNVADPDGYPYGFRRRPRRDPSAGVLRLDLAEGEAFRPDPRLPYHDQDEVLWNQKIFLLWGSLEGAVGKRTSGRRGPSGVGGFGPWCVY